MEENNLIVSRNSLIYFWSDETYSLNMIALSLKVYFNDLNKNVLDITISPYSSYFKDKNYRDTLNSDVKLGTALDDILKQACELISEKDSTLEFNEARIIDEINGDILKVYNLNNFTPYYNEKFAKNFNEKHKDLIAKLKEKESPDE